MDREFTHPDGAGGAMTAEQLSSIVETVTIGVAPDQVWPFLVEPRHVSRWLGCMRYTGEIGSVFYMQQDESKRADDDIDGATHCEVLELVQPRRFVFSWYLPDTPRTTVEIELRDDGVGGTIVALEHSGWDNFDPGVIRHIRSGLEGGWRSYVLPALKRVVTEGTGS